VTLEQSKGGPHMSLTHCPRHDMIWGSRSQIELELEINQPPLAHNSQLIAAQGEAIKGFGQQRLCSWRLRLVRTASPKGNPILTVTKYAGAMGRSATSMAGEVRNPAERRGQTGGGDGSGGGTSKVELPGHRADRDWHQECLEPSKDGLTRSKLKIIKILGGRGGG
jgi:hypothetical protein